MKERAQRAVAVTLPAMLGAAVLAGPASSADHYAELYAEILTRHTYEVSSTAGLEVDYRALRSEPAASGWRKLLAGLAAARRPVTRAEKLTLWINAYNILAIDMVLRHYPLDSIRDVGSFFRPVWKHDAGSVAGRPVTLHQIEHEILRPLGNPRIHAALVCASTSCPSLRRDPYAAAQIDAQLDEALRMWLSDPKKGLAIDRAGERIVLSRVFDWFEDDFDALGGVLATLATYAPEADRAWLSRRGAGARIDYFKYDWTLNDHR